MTLAERKRIVVNAIRYIERKLIVLKHCEYDGAMSVAEREAEQDRLQSHLRGAHGALLLINEEEIEEAA